MKGALVTLGVSAVAAAAGLGVTAIARGLGVTGLCVEAAALSTLFSLRGLLHAAQRVETALARGDLEAARTAVGEDLVSRPTAGLDEGHLVSATVESIAENLTDSVLAPVCFYLAFGLAGAAVYRAMNTADTMVGYRDGVLEHFGKVAARLDDVLNLVPARLAGLAIVAAAALLPGLHASGAWRVMWRDHARTASPNAGWTMSAAAGALGVVLVKPKAYRLGTGPLPRVSDIARGRRLVALAAALAVGMVLAVRAAVGVVAD